jgi:ectoine hydroxylase-related dioxygenase (phytanoyl-CoA dioxygenase family)
MFTEEEKAGYREKGYLLASGFLSAGQVDEFRAAVDSIGTGNTRAAHDASRVEMEPDQSPEGTRVRRIYEPCTYYPVFRSLSESQRLLDAVSDLIGPDLSFHYSKINMKPPSVGSAVEWHQDLAYYPLTNPDSLAVLFYLDDADKRNGCLQVLPGSPGRPLLDHSRGGLFQGRITEPLDESRAVPLEGKAGGAIFLHALTPHASVANRSDRARRTLILSYRAADAYPLHVPGITDLAEKHVRPVRGRPREAARFSGDSIRVPRYPKQVLSLYELQSLSRTQAGTGA